MKVAVASGKGGTGKTTVATNLAHVAAGQGLRVAYLDCDVEEPNGHLFLEPAIADSSAITCRVPQVNQERCDGCGQCGKLCQYSAIVCVGDRPLLFPTLCHSCGGCAMVCPRGAIQEVPRPIGTLRIGNSDGIRFVEGRLNVGEAMSPPAIRAVKAAALPADIVIIDAPPGTSCPVIESVRGCDLVLLVTEPTPFGLNDLSLAVEMVSAMQLPMAVVINRADAASGDVADYCRRKDISVLLEIPEDRQIAKAYSKGQLAVALGPHYRAMFGRLLSAIRGCPANVPCASHSRSGT